MGKAVVLILCCLTFFAASSTALDIGCNFYQDLVPGNTYYVYNPLYPYPYQAPRSCMWTIRSEYGVNLTCTSFQLPWSNNCSQDKLSIQISASTTHQYCGDGTFNIVSEGNLMVVTLQVPASSTGGRFLCEAQAIKRPEEMETCRCGWKNPTRIVGGMDTGVNEFPMMCGLVDTVNRIVRCGCTIIAHRYVLTAAHCVDDQNINELGILVGDHDLRTGMDTNATMLHRVNRALIHPQYTSNLFQNDLALLQTDRDILFSNQVGPACLPFQHAPDTFGGNFVQLLGWGLLDTSGPLSDVLQKVTMSVLTPLECSRFYNVTSSQLCTYTEGKDSCGMDSGGPVLWTNPTSDRTVLVGVISFGSLCAVSGGVNSRVGAYMDWIVSSTPGATYCIME